MSSGPGQGDGRAQVRLTHQAEQSRAALSEVGVLLGSYYKQLLGQGFTEPQAFTLVLQIQAMLMQRKT